MHPCSLWETALFLQCERPSLPLVLRAQSFVQLHTEPMEKAVQWMT